MNILLIDDEQSLRKSLRIALETMNHHVSEASDGSQAQELLGHGLFDIAFLDLRLGQGNRARRVAGPPQAGTGSGGHRHHGLRHH